MNKIPLPPSYHNLADTRKLLNVKNGYNVISNLAVFAPTLYLLQKHNLNTKNKILAFHISLIALTSTYYHLYPTNARIVWDMLSIATTHAVVLSYFVEENIAMTLYLFSIISVIYWSLYNDLRPYILLLVGIPLYIILQIYNDERVKQYIIPLIISGVFARYAEYNDSNIFKITNKTISGHTLKHLSAGISLYVTIIILGKLEKL
jgi:hypothetical protein